MSRGRDHLLRAAAGAAVMAALWVAGLHVGGLATGLLFLAPAFALLLPLLAGRYPGAERLEEARHRPIGRVVAPAPRAPRPRLCPVPRGGLLVGCSLAGRAPPG